MIASQITKLLAGGHSAEELLDLLVKNAPKLKKEVSTLLGSGWGAKDVLERVADHPGAKGSDFKRFQPLSPEETASHYVQKGERQKAESPQGRALDTAKGFGKAALGAGIGLAGAALLPAALARAAPSLAGVAGGVTGATPQAAAPIAAVASQAAPAAATAVANAIRKPTSNDPKEVLQALGIFDRIHAAKGQGKSPELLALASNKLLSPEAKEIAKSNDINVPGAVWEYLTGRPGPEETPLPQQVAQPVEEPKQSEASLPTETKAKEEPAKPEPGKEAILPDGKVGEIETIDPNGKYVTVNVNGQKRRVRFEDVEIEPENMVDFVNQVAAIPESERSRLISFFAYQPETKTLAVQFHNGNFYTYSDVDEELIKPIAEAKGVAKTSGSDEYGSHIAGVADSRGAALIEEIINNPKYAKPKKGESKNPNYQLFGTIYDYWEKLRRKPKRKKKESS